MMRFSERKNRNFLVRNAFPTLKRVHRPGVDLGLFRTPEAPIYGCPRYWGFEGPKSALSLSEFWGFEGKIAQTLSVLGDLRLIWDALDLVHGPKII